jgi:hypothetical protein
MNPEIPSVPPPLSPQLQNALHLLRFHDLDDLERHFLSTDAFLTPWAHFRDHCLLQVKNGMTEDASKGDINKMDILYWYTHYDEGRRRYDPAFDEEKHGCASEMNRENYGMIDTSNWTDLEYKKLLYVWLLQTFQVGKSFNAHNFQYFELRNICTAWENVFVPIVAAVRADYNPKGRYHYGRLARFIEAARPSKLAFPDPNMSTSPLKHTPAKSLGFTTTPDLINDPAMVVDPVTGVVTRTQNKVWDEEDRELREAFAKYGQLVERPKAKEKVEMWLKEQHALCQRRRALEHLDNGAKETRYVDMVDTRVEKSLT